MTKNQLKYLCFLFSLLIFGYNSGAQDTFDQIEKLSIFSTGNEIINGEQWVYQNKFKGHPFWNKDIWYYGNIIFRGKKYENISIRYDIHNNNIIVLKKLNDKTRAYTLNKSFLESFEIYDQSTGKLFTFNYNRLKNSLNKEIYYHAYAGESNYYIFYRKDVNNRVSTYYTGEYIFAPKLYADINGIIIEFKTYSEFLKLFGDRKQEIKKFMRREKIKFKKQTPEDVIPVFSYFDTINRTTPEIND